MIDFEQYQNVYRFLDDQELVNLKIDNGSTIIDQDKLLHSHNAIITNAKPRIAEIAFKRLLKLYNKLRNEKNTKSIL
jgi:hypothetical protein